MGVLAETLGEVGEAEEAMDLLVRALEKARTHGERASEIDLHRIHAKLLLTLSESNLPEAIGALQVGARLATKLGARTHLLRSLAELFRLTGDSEVGVQLQRVVAGFDEGLTEPGYVRASATLSVSRRKTE